MFESQSRRGGGRRGRRDRGREDGRQMFVDNEPRGPKTKAPPNLRGRQIGLFYRDLNRKKRQEPPRLELPMELKDKIERVLSSVTNDGSSRRADGSFSFKREYLDIVSVPYMQKLNEALENDEPSHQLEMWNEKLFNEHLEKLDSTDYQRMLGFRKKLPAYEKRADILKCIRENQVTVISGETGCGKTTQVGQLVLEEACANKKGGQINVIITQPRRIAASSVAMRIASERAENLGRSVGYTIRLESKPPRHYGSIELVTNGVLLQRLQNDPALLKVSHLILDEVHERDSICDIVMGVVKKIITKRKDLKVILMSATIDADRFCNYFDGCPQLHIPGLMFPVKEYYLEDALELTGFCQFAPNKTANFSRSRRANEVRHRDDERKKYDYSRFIRPYVEDLRQTGKYSERTLENIKDYKCEELCLEFVASLVQSLARGPDGGILVFLPGFTDISKVCKLLQDMPLPPHLLLPLHSRLNSMDQQAIFRTPPKGVRKIVVSTNIAETSITIDDIVYVVDAGKMKLTDYVAERDMSTLEGQWVSEANAHQRRGRAGRVQPGECWKLYTKARADQFDARPAPELLRAPLHEPILSVLLLRLGPAQSFLKTLLDPPNDDAVNNAIRLLHRMRIIDNNDRLTPLGIHVARLPVHPGAARMLLLSALMSCVAPATAIAATIAFRDPFVLPIGKEREVEEQKRILSRGHGSDQIAAAEAQLLWESKSSRDARDFCYDSFLSWRSLEMLRDMRFQFGSLLYSAQFTGSSNPDSRSSNLNSHNYSLIKALVVAGLYPNIATYKNSRCLMTEEENRLELHPSSVNMNRPPPAARLAFFMKQKSTSLYLHGTSPAHALPLLFFGDNYKVTEYPNDPLNMCVEIGDAKWITSSDTARLLGDLRYELDTLLQNKLENPGPVNWESSEGHILTAIIDLITAEDDPIQYDAEMEMR